MTNETNKGITAWDKTFIETVDLYEKHSKCAAKSVVCILVKENNILSIGINGTISGKVNCNEKFKKVQGVWKKKNLEGHWVNAETDEHYNWSRINEVHAEMNAVKKATQNNGFNLEGATAYVSFSPCFNCAKMLALFGIKRIVYREAYDDIEDVSKFLLSNNIKLIECKLE